jgi:GNAT superfamily N-acetyltransferase
MLVCLVDDRIAGNCMISFRTGMKDRHRAGVAIALLQDFWGLGIGTRMFEELIRIAEERGEVRQIELDGRHPLKRRKLCERIYDGEETVSLAEEWQN